MNHTLSFLTLRSKQLYRLLRETGIVITLIAIFLLTGGILRFIEVALKANPIFAIIGPAIIVVVVDIMRNDKPFINQIFGSKIKSSQYLSIEYLLPFLPLIIYKLVIGQYLIALGIGATILILALLSPHISKPLNQGYKKSLSFISLRYFELKFFAEKRKTLFFITIALLFSGVIHVSLWILGIFMLMSFVLEMFMFQEPMEMIHWKEGFVRKKIVSYSLLLLPLLLVSSALSYLRSDLSIWVFVYGTIAILVALAVGLSNKYAEYYGFTKKLPTSTPMMIMVFLMLLPGFVIVTIGYTIMKYTKAENQIKQLCSK